jgi:flagellar hook-associated protein 2
MATTAVSSSTSSATTAAASTTAANIAAANKAAAQKIMSSLSAGSGVDTASLAQNLVDAEKTPQVNAINAKISKNDARVSGYSAVAFVLSDLNTAFTALKDQNSFNSVTPNNSQPNAFSVTATSTAAVANHDVQVLQLAKAQRRVSDGFASASTPINGGRSMRLQFGIGSTDTWTPTLSTVQGHDVTTETSQVKFTALLSGQSITVAGLTYTASQDLTPQQVAAAFSGLAESALSPADTTQGAFSGALMGFNASVASGENITFTSTTAGSVADIAVTTSIGVAAPIVTTSQGRAAETETSAITFKDMAIGQSVTVAGLTYTATQATSAAEVATLFSGMTASSTTPTNPAKGTFSGALTGFNSGLSSGGTLNFASTTSATNVADIAVSGAKVSISLPAGRDTPQDIADFINAGNTGITAAVVNTGDGSASPYQLVLTGASGSTGAFTLNTSYAGSDGMYGSTPAAGGSGLNFSGVKAGDQSATDARVKIDGISYTRSTNSLTDVMPGVTIDIKDVTIGSASLAMVRDTTAIKDKFNTLVSSYNDAMSMLGVVTDPKSTVATYGATLVGDSTVRSIRTQVRAMVQGASTTPGASITSMWQLGIKVDQAGVMSLDATKLDAALSNSFSDVVKTMTGNTNGLSAYSVQPAGFAGEAVRKLTKLVSATGPIVSNSDNATTQNTKYQDQLSKLDTRMTALLARYTKQFAAMNSIVGNVNSQKTSLKATFDGMMAAYTGK